METLAVVFVPLVIVVCVFLFLRFRERARPARRAETSRTMDLAPVLTAMPHAAAIEVAVVTRAGARRTVVVHFDRTFAVHLETALRRYAQTLEQRTANLEPFAL